MFLIVGLTFCYFTLIVANYVLKRSRTESSTKNASVLKKLWNGYTQNFCYDVRCTFAAGWAQNCTWRVGTTFGNKYSSRTQWQTVCLVRFGLVANFIDDKQQYRNKVHLYQFQTLLNVRQNIVPSIVFSSH